MIPKKTCCKSPDVKDEGGWTNDQQVRITEFHCFSCGKTWTERTKPVWTRAALQAVDSNGNPVRF